jgi:predicted negative regulator of RcsB-dependent stress response
LDAGGKKLTFYKIMQTQDAPAEIIFKLWPWVEANKNRLIGGLVVILVGIGIAYFISAQRAQKEIDAGQALTALMVNPGPNRSGSQMASALEQLATSYAGTAAGQRAQLQAAAALFEAGSYAEAQTQFKKYLDANPSGSFADTAELGIAASLEAQNQTDPAAAAYQRVISIFPSSSSVAPAEFALGRIAERQNKLTEAMSHYESVVRASLGGSLRDQAMMHASEVKAKIDAAAPKPAAKPQAEMAPKPVVPTPSQPASKP